jgi:hypothetical protein
VIRPEFGEAVGSANLIFLLPDGSRKTGQVRVGRPYKSEDGNWACPCELVGLEPRYADIRGGDSLQALCLAISLLRRRLEDFIDKGGTILHADESEWSQDSFSATFGDVGLTRGGDAA